MRALLIVNMKFSFHPRRIDSRIAAANERKRLLEEQKESIRKENERLEQKLRVLTIVQILETEKFLNQLNECIKDYEKNIGSISSNLC